jgi:hypothetical protein
MTVRDSGTSKSSGNVGHETARPAELVVDGVTIAVKVSDHREEEWGPGWRAVIATRWWGYLLTTEYRSAAVPGHVVETIEVFHEAPPSSRSRVTLHQQVVAVHRPRD